MADNGQNISGNHNVQIAGDAHFTLNQVSDEEEKRINILNEIFDYVFQFVITQENQEELLRGLNTDKKILNLREKIPLNCDNPEQESIVKEMFLNLWGTCNHVEDFIEEYDNEGNILGLKEMIQSKNRELKQAQNTIVEVLDELPYVLLPDNRKKDPEYYGCAKAIIYYFFERCDIGKKTKKELNDAKLF